jgi:hypothetical protein
VYTPYVIAELDSAFQSSEARHLQIHDLFGVDSQRFARNAGRLLRRRAKMT